MCYNSKLTTVLVLSALLPVSAAAEFSGELETLFKTRIARDIYVFEQAFARRQSHVDPAQGLVRANPSTMGDLFPAYGFSPQLLSFHLGDGDAGALQVCASVTVHDRAAWAGAVSALTESGYRPALSSCVPSSSFSQIPLQNSTVTLTAIREYRSSKVMPLSIVPPELDVQGLARVGVTRESVALSAPPGGWGPSSLVEFSFSWGHNNPEEPPTNAVTLVEASSRFEAETTCSEQFPRVACSLSLRFQGGSTGERPVPGVVRVLTSGAPPLLLGLKGLTQEGVPLE